MVKSRRSARSARRARPARSSKITQRISRFLLKFGTVFFVVSLFFVLLFRFVPVYVTPLMVIRVVEQLTGGKELRLQHHWVPLEAISKNLPLAVFCSEDQNFVNHFGFDFKAIERAVAASQNGTKRLRGASTISQQTAKNVFLWPGRSWVRKGLEAYFTVLIEIVWGKERIMEVYLNSIEMGQGVYGAEAASRYYFKKNAKDLSRTQAAAIAAVLPNPREYSANPPTAYIKSRINWITGQMRHQGTLSFK